MELANSVNKERQASEKDVRFLKPRSISAYPGGKNGGNGTTLDADRRRGGDWRGDG